MVRLEVFSPAKINLFLAITGRRADGFHDLVSVVASLDFGDRLRFEPAADFSLTCSDPALACDETNLVMRAARAFRQATDWRGAAAIHLEKRIPLGAGLGGGSSNATTTLLALNRLAGLPLSQPELERVAAGLGSDCPLFLAEGPVVMRGRGERIERLPVSAARRLSGRRVLLFKPSFGINTAWAYGRMVALAPDSYLPAVQAEERLTKWLSAASAPAEELLFNNMERPAFEKFVALPALLERLRRDGEVAVGMSGSGSACFAVLPPSLRAEPLRPIIEAAWGPGAVLAEALIR